MYLIKDIDIITPEKILKNYDIKFDKKIIEIKKVINDKDKTNLEIINGKNYYLTPGFIDLHIHGSFGIDLMSVGINEIKKMSRQLLTVGTTSFLPTVMTSSYNKILKVVSNIKTIAKDDKKIIGVNLEGPLLNPKKAGAQDKKYMEEINLELFERYDDLIKIVTVAPEVKGADKLIKKLKSLNIVASMGHTDASYQESLKGFKEGISLATHLFNGMRGIHHRDIGAAGAALLEDISVELIVDGIHVSKPMLELIFKIKDIDKIILITDAQPAALYQGNDIKFNGKKVLLKDDSARYEDGTLAGSVLSMHKAVKNMADFTNFSLPKIFKMATLNPARKIGIDSELGTVEKNKRADLLLLNKDLEICDIFKNGKRIQ